MTADSDILDPSLAGEGQLKIEWADRQMPVLARIRERFEKDRPLEGLTIAACLHVTSETANLVRTLAAGGADVALCASNPLSTQDDTSASLVEDFLQSVYGVRGVDNDIYYKHIEAALSIGPNLTID